MDVVEIRRNNLRWLIEQAGGTVSLATKIDREPNYVTQLQGEYKAFGSRIARHIESVLGKEHGWMDRPQWSPGAPGSPSVAPAETRADRLAPPSHVVRLDRDMLRDAMISTERVIAKYRLSVTPEGRADLALALYDVLVEGTGMEQAERIVSGMLRALSGSSVKS